MTQADLDTHLRLETEARDFLNHIEACAIQSIESALLVDEDRKRLQYSIDRLRPAFNELTKWFIDPLKETRLLDAMHGYGKLWQLLAAAFLAGSRGTISKSAEGVILKEAQAERGRKSAEARGGNNRPWLQHAKELAIEGRGQNGGLSNIDLAAEIKAGWKIENPPAPGMNTLTKYVSDLVKAGELPAALRKARIEPVR